MSEDFSNHPVSLTEARAERDCDMSAWKPRDVLIHLLRQIDAGEVNVETLVIAYRHKDRNGDYFTSNLKCAESMPNVIGVLEIAKAKILHDWFD